MRQQCPTCKALAICAFTSISKVTLPQFLHFICSDVQQWIPRLELSPRFKLASPGSSGSSRCWVTSWIGRAVHQDGRRLRSASACRSVIKNKERVPVLYREWWFQKRTQKEKMRFKLISSCFSTTGLRYFCLDAMKTPVKKGENAH